MIATPTVTVTPPGGAAVDVTCLVDEVSISHGRDDTDSQPDASTATVNLSTDDDLGPFPPDLEVGATVTVALTLAGVTYPRFVGFVTDVTYGWDDAGDQTPNRPVGQIMASGVLADVAFRIVGDTPYPQELDGARVNRVLTAAGYPLDPAYSDPGTVQVLARDVDAAQALEVAQEAAASARGVIWQTRAGTVRYADADHRRNTVPALELDACDVLVSPAWSRTTAGLVNDVSVAYGVAPEGGDRPTYRSERADSIAKYRRRAVTLDTVLADAADATALANLLLTRNSSPVWIMAVLPVDVAGLDQDRTAALLALDVDSLVTLTGLPVVGSAPTTVDLWVEGITERLAYGGHDLGLVVSGYCRTVPPPRWDDLLPTWTWDTIPGTWDEATCLGPQPSLGRWDDVPASTRWDQVPAGTTWDEWKG